MRLLNAACCLIVMICGVPLILDAQMGSPFPQQCEPPPQTNRPAAARPVPRTVNVTVPMPSIPPTICPAPSTMPYACQPGLPYPNPTVPKPTPVRFEVSVHPEGPDQRRPVPVVYRDPGFLGPIVINSMGLVGAVIAAPFRVAEMLVPLEAQPQSQRNLCSPPPGSRHCGNRPPVNPPPWAPKCPVPITQPVPPCPPVFACAPPGPSVAPLPPCASPPQCGPFMPPAMVARNEEPPCAPQSLLGGILGFPATLVERGRFFGDFSSSEQNQSY